MKKSILAIISMFLFTVVVYAGGVPEVVQKAFEKKFPAAINVKWNKENAHEYEANFEWKKEIYSANFSDKGTWLETENPSALNRIPGRIQKAFYTTHKGATVKKVTKIETSKGIVKYEIECMQGEKTVEFFYTADGTEVK